MNELPTGTVTFLFSDIAGSTRLLRELRDRYAELISDYQRLMRKVFAEHGGLEIDTQGDSFFAAFAQARDAVLAAARAQRAIAEHPWPSAIDLRVRVGLHTGGASVAGDRYLGLAVHRAARICAAGHGGQTLLSQATYTLLEDEEEELAGLKDFDRPVRLYQLVVPGLQIDFPPLRTATAKTPFGGREGDLAEAIDAAAAVPFLRRYRRPLVVAGAVLIAATATAVGLALSKSQSNARAPISVVPNSIAEVDPQTNRVVADLPVGDTPTAVAYGVGAVWVSNTNGQTVSKVDPRTLGTQTFHVPGRPADIVAASGRVFAAELFGERLFVLGLQGVLENTITIAGGGVIRDSGLGAIAVRGGKLWLFESRRGVLVRLDPTSGRIMKRVPTPRETILAFALTKDWLWATTLEQDVLRIDSVTGRIVARLSLVNALNGIAAAGDSVWVAAGSRAVELEGAANVVESTVSIGQQEPGGEAFGKGVQGIAVAGKDVWVTDPVGGRIVRIDARTGTIVRAIRVGS